MLLPEIYLSDDDDDDDARTITYYYHRGRFQIGRIMPDIHGAIMLPPYTLEHIRIYGPFKRQK
jgi:hypothetical protein